MYSYQAERCKLFTEEGQETFLKIRDKVKRLIKEAGAVRFLEGSSGCGGGDAWFMLACFDRMIELGEIREVTDSRVAGQHRIFTSKS